MLNLYANILGIEQWIIILVLALLLFGGKKIPELMRGLGKGVGELQKGLDEGKRALMTAHEEAKTEEPKAPLAAPVGETAPSGPTK